MIKYNIYKRKDGRFEGRWTVYDNDSAKKKYFYGETREDVQLKIQQYIKSIVEAENNSLRRFNSTVKEMAIEFLEVKKVELRQNTIGQYQMNIYKHIIPILGKYKIYEMDDTLREKFYNYLEGLQKPLARRTKQDLKRLLENIIQYSKVMAKIRIQEEESDINYLSAENIAKLNNYINVGEVTTSKLMVLIVLYTGIRIGELCGLKWSNINFETSSITVSHTVQRVYCGYTAEGAATKVLSLPIKERTIPIPEPLMETLKKCQKSAFYYVATESTKGIEPRALQYRLATIAKNVGISKMDFSGLRDTFAINCLNCGVSPKYLADIMGITPESLAKYILISSPYEDIKTALSRLKY